MHKNRIFYCLYLIGIFYLSMIYNNYGLYVILFMSLILPVVSLIYCLCLMGKVYAEWGAPEHDPGEIDSTKVTLWIRNNSFLTTGDVIIRFAVADVQKNQSKRMKKKTAVVGRANAKEMLEAEFNHPGNVTCMLKKVRVCDPLGLFSCAGSVTMPEVSFSVMPILSEITATPFRHNPYAYIEEEEYSTVKPGDDPSELFGTREYRPGDRRNRIHWALTAKQDELIVKELGLPVECACIVFLDMIRTDDDGEITTLFETAFSLSEHLAANGHRHRFVWYDTVRGVVCRQAVERPDDVYSVIPQVFGCRLSAENESIVPLYFAEYPRERYRNIFYLTNGKSTAGLEALRNLRGDAYTDCYLIARSGTNKDEGEWKETVVRPYHLHEDFSGEGGTQ
ncbi:MAG: DUF58 domain-containing protein [Lachnospiraceae bacterium]|nr:DUF58 domain-containing protein [Lachnospiraceae bacterium]